MITKKELSILTIVITSLYISTISSFGETMVRSENNKRKEYKNTILKYEAALKENPTDADLHYKVGTYFYHAGYKDEGIKKLETAKQLYIARGEIKAALEIDSILSSLKIDEALEQIDKRLKKLSQKVNKIIKVLDKNKLIPK